MAAVEASPFPDQTPTPGPDVPVPTWRIPLQDTPEQRIKSPQPLVPTEPDIPGKPTGPYRFPTDPYRSNVSIVD